MNIEKILTERLHKLQKIREAFEELVDPKAKRFLRGPFQLQVLEKCDMPQIGPNKKLVNEVAYQLGYRLIRIRGIRYFKLVH